MNDTPEREPLLSEAQASKMAVDADTRQLGGIAVQRYYENLIDTGVLMVQKEQTCIVCGSKFELYIDGEWLRSRCSNPNCNPVITTSPDF